MATPTGDDGVALASALAKTFDAEMCVVLVVRREMPDRHPVRAEYQRLLVGESFAQSLIDFAGGRLQPVRGAEADLPRLDGGAHPCGHRCAGDRGTHGRAGRSPPNCSLEFVAFVARSH